MPEGKVMRLMLKGDELSVGGFGFFEGALGLDEVGGVGAEGAGLLFEIEHVAPGPGHLALGAGEVLLELLQTTLEGGGVEFLALVGFAGLGELACECGERLRAGIVRGFGGLVLGACVADGGFEAV